jgi:hypothetical protein
MAMRASEIAPTRVTVHASDFLEAVIVALESGEFRQIRGQVREPDTTGRCAWGVAVEIGGRAGLDSTAVSARLGRAWWEAGRALGNGTIPAANDAGVSFATIAQALRQAQHQAGR